MPKKVRLTRKDTPHMRGVFREHGALFSVSVAPSEKGTKVTCIIPKKVAPKASARNLIKRRARAIIREIVMELPPSLLLLQAKKDAASATHDQLHRDIVALMKKVRVRHGV